MLLRSWSKILFRHLFKQIACWDKFSVLYCNFLLFFEILGISFLRLSMLINKLGNGDKIWGKSKFLMFDSMGFQTLLTKRLDAFLLRTEILNLFFLMTGTECFCIVISHFVSVFVFAWNNFKISKLCPKISGKYNKLIMRIYWSLL